MNLRNTPSRSLFLERQKAKSADILERKKPSICSTSTGNGKKKVIRLTMSVSKASTNRKIGDTTPIKKSNKKIPIENLDKQLDMIQSDVEKIISDHENTSPVANNKTMTTLNLDEKFVLTNHINEEPTSLLSNYDLPRVCNNENMVIHHSNDQCSTGFSSNPENNKARSLSQCTNSADERHLIVRPNLQLTNPKRVSVSLQNDNHQIISTNKRLSTGIKTTKTVENFQQKTIIQSRQSSSHQINESSRDLVSFDKDYSTNFIHAMLEQQRLSNHFENKDFQYYCLEQTIKAITDKEKSFHALEMLYREVNLVFEGNLLPLNDRFHPLFLFDKDMEPIFEFYILNTRSPSSRLPCSDNRILRLSKLIYSFVWKFHTNISE